MTRKEQTILEAYQRAINRIDDYFEHDRMAFVVGNKLLEEGKTFKECQERVHMILGELTKKLVELKE